MIWGKDELNKMCPEHDRGSCSDESPDAYEVYLWATDKIRRYYERVPHYNWHRVSLDLRKLKAIVTTF